MGFYLRYGFSIEHATIKESFDSYEEILKFSDLSVDEYCAKFSNIISKIESDGVYYKGCFCNPRDDSIDYITLPYIAIIEGNLIGQNVWNDGAIVEVEKTIFVGTIKEFTDSVLDKQYSDEIIFQIKKITDGFIDWDGAEYSRIMEMIEY